MQPGLKFLFEHHHDRSLDLHAGEARKRLRLDLNRKMRLSGGTCPGMAGMGGAVVAHLQPVGRKRFRQEVIYAV